MPTPAPAHARPSGSPPAPPRGEEGWRRLVRHSYRLGAAWAAREAPRRWPGSRAALQRLLVPLDPWRFWELGRAAEQEFAGPCLDVSSPKLLMSLLQAEGRGEWVGVDLDATEIARWHHVDPALDLRVEDARSLPFPDGAFATCACISVVEHIPGEGDAEAMREMWRVLRPGGELVLTTNVASRDLDVHVADRRYGSASVETGTGLYFFERRYSAAAIDRRLQGMPWEVRVRDYARMRRGWVHDGFARLAPASYPFGFALRWLCPSAFEAVADPSELADDEMGVVLLRLRKPAEPG